MNIKLKFKLEKKIAYVLTAAFILGSIVQSNTSIKGEMKEAVTTMGEVLEEIPENEQGMDYIIMTNEQGDVYKRQ